MECEHDFEKAMKKTRENINQYKWSAFYVSGDHDAQEPGFSYTMGLTESFKHAELIMFALPYKSAHIIMANLIKLVIETDKPLPTGEKIEDIANLPLVLKEVLPDRAAEYATGDNFLYGDRGYRLYQIVWCDPNGNFPWEEGWDSNFDNRQPRLWEEARG